MQIAPSVHFVLIYCKLLLWVGVKSNTRIYLVLRRLDWLHTCANHQPPPTIIYITIYGIFQCQNDLETKNTSENENDFSVRVLVRNG